MASSSGADAMRTALQELSSGAASGGEGGGGGGASSSSSSSLEDGAKRLLAEAGARGDVAAARAWVEFVLSDAVPPVSSRALASSIPELFSTSFGGGGGGEGGGGGGEQEKGPRVLAEALSAALELLQPRSASFESAAAAASAGGGFGGGAPLLARLRRALASAHERGEDWGAAARALAGIDVETIGALAAAASSAAATGGDGKGGGTTITTTTAAAAPRASLAPAIAEKLSHCVRVAMLYLEDEDAGSAESFVRKAAPLAAALASAGADAKSSSSSSSSTPPFSAAAALADLGLELQYRSCSARVLDARRDFTRAAAAYSALSRAREPGSVGGPNGAPAELVSDEELDAALAAAVTCAVLAPPSAARTRVLASLWRDANRASGGFEPHAQRGTRRERLSPSLLGVLRSVRSERLLTRDDAKALDAALTMPHHRAVGADGATVLERALREHNLAAAARVYSALTLRSLGELLGLGGGRGNGGGNGGGGGGGADDGAAAEEGSTSASSSDAAAHLAEAMAAKMVAEGRLRATIDQVDGIITFEESGGGDGGVGVAVGGGRGGGGAALGAAGDGGGEAGDEDDVAIAALCEGLDAVAAAVAV